MNDVLAMKVHQSLKDLVNEFSSYGFTQKTIATVLVRN